MYEPRPDADTLFKHNDASKNMQWKIIGVSLSDPHISGHALHMHVCILACDHKFKMSTFKHFMKIKTSSHIWTQSVKG